MYQLIFNSLYIAVVSSLGSIVVACVLSVWTYFFQNTFLSKYISVFGLLPFLCGSVVIGVVCDWLAKFGSYTPWTAVIFSHVLLNYPFASRSIQTQLCSYNAELTKTAASLGAQTWEVCSTIILPYAKDSLRYAWCLVFGLSLVEIGAVSVMHGDIMTLPLAIRLVRKAGYQDDVFALSFVLLLTIFVTSWSTVKIKNAQPKNGA